MTVNKNKCRINAYISQKNYVAIDELMKKEHSPSMSKGLILDLALSNFFRAIDVGESLENLTIQHLESIGDENIESLNPEGDEPGF